MKKELTPSLKLLTQVRAGLICKGTNLHKWCIENKVLYSTARQALIGTWSGEKGSQLCNKLIIASGLNEVK